MMTEENGGEFGHGAYADEPSKATSIEQKLSNVATWFDVVLKDTLVANPGRNLHVKSMKASLAKLLGACAPRLPALADAERSGSLLCAATGGGGAAAFFRGGSFAAATVAPEAERRARFAATHLALRARLAVSLSAPPPAGVASLAAEALPLIDRVPCTRRRIRAGAIRRPPTVQIQWNGLQGEADVCALHELSIIVGRVVIPKVVTI